MSERFNYYRAGSNRWWRAFGIQIGYYPHGRRPLFSERNGFRKPPLTFRLGRRQVTICRVRRLP